MYKVASENVQSSAWPCTQQRLTSYRCVELDCWDGAGGEPEVYHGFTLTQHIKLSEVLPVIAENAFIASRFPVILSLEMHCSPVQQAHAPS